MDKKAFIAECGMLFDLLQKEGAINIAPYIVNQMKSLIPSKAALPIIKSEILKIANPIEMDINYQPGGYRIVFDDYVFGPKFIITIIDSINPFKIEIKMLDSYYEPQLEYCNDCGPTYLDTDMLLKDGYTIEQLSNLDQETIDNYTFTNDNWEPSTIESITFQVKDTNELWAQLKEAYNNLKTIWSSYSEPQKIKNPR